ncbi:MAG TPA: hypothetical protein DFR83_20975, partial [Deltaproteobacteria bacterium]|nr:hypothetical protein [Deltaproteobacteria bacterium]
IRIGASIPWSCGLDVASSGMPTRLVDCVGENGWGMEPATIALRCTERAHDELCRGAYTLVADTYRKADQVSLSRALHPTARWPW